MPKSINQYLEDSDPNAFGRLREQVINDLLASLNLEELSYSCYIVWYETFSSKMLMSSKDFSCGKAMKIFNLGIEK